MFFYYVYPSRLAAFTVEILMGHRALGLTGIYFKPTPNDLLEGNDKMLGYANIICDSSSCDGSLNLTLSQRFKCLLSPCDY